jgi:hypothetical protein
MVPHPSTLSAQRENLDLSVCVSRGVCLARRRAPSLPTGVFEPTLAEAFGEARGPIDGIKR